MLDKSTILKHYKREDIQKEMILHAKDKEVVGSFKGGGYARRPDVLTYPNDIMELVKQGVTSFHASEELWSNPLRLDPLLKKQEMDDLRIGWDLVIDIDCPHWPYSKRIAYLVVQFLKHHMNISSVSVKFSGNKGFHIGIPFEAFPKKIAGEETSKMFPEYIREVALYIKKRVQGIFLKQIMEQDTAESIAEKLGKKVEDISKKGAIDASEIVAIDTILISIRHLYRVPYSLHEKSGLVSLPIHPDSILAFTKEEASPDKVKVDSSLRFLDREHVKEGEAKELFDNASAEKVEKESLNRVKEERTYKNPRDSIPETAIPEEFFPPCIKLILSGVEDGRKRSTFILRNFLTSVGWSYDDIEKKIKECNKKSKDPLREVIITGQLRYHKQLKKNVLPPNCDNKAYYLDFGVCKPDNLCKMIKNPVQYSKRKTYYLRKKK